MPQASDELRTLMEERFGDPIDDADPIKFLQAAGYKLTRNWFWLPKPGITCAADMTQEEFDCMVFLIHEWDFGDLVKPSILGSGRDK